jgi:glycosyltransferase involved in cell wall biosynthesis
LVAAGQRIGLVLPARDEEAALPAVLASIPSWVDSVIVVDNGSQDDTARVAARCGAQVVTEPVMGYGQACLAGIRALLTRSPAIIAFADSDGSDDLARLEEVVRPLLEGRADLVLARRIPVESGALTPQQRLGNRLATRLVRIIWGHSYADLGPMRAISRSALERLDMDDTGFGWTIQMQIRAITRGLRIDEVDLPYRSRLAGKSKISKTLRGSVSAGATILSVIAKEAARERPKRQRVGTAPLLLSSRRGMRARGPQ